MGVWGATWRYLGASRRTPRCLWNEGGWDSMHCRWQCQLRHSPMLAANTASLFHMVGSPNDRSCCVSCKRPLHGPQAHAAAVGTSFFSEAFVATRGYLVQSGLFPSPACPCPFALRDALSSREFCALLGLSRVAVIGFSAGTPFATAVACVPPSGTTTTTATTTTTTTTTSSNIATSSLTTRVKNPTSGLPANDVKSSPIVGNPLCSPADDAQPAAPVVTLTSTPAASAAADSIAAVAPAAVLSPVATEATAATASTAAAATTVTSTSTLTVTATPTLAAASISRVTAPAVSAPHPPYNKALASTEVRTETAPDPPAVVALVSAIGPPDVPNKGRGMALVFRVGAVRLLGMQARAFDNGDDGQSSSFGAETATSGRVAQAICAVQRQG
ncbi:hypothetical protein Vretifemale_4804 [Volvox reticuliferus]|uniref:Uncharacterized protein n=1 Tax=Volvox reticuliferus TaxID=1737510 RepID=A0A8J4CA30_9CHLO|nr:hypothetical protein Vretifemale_4804 [Volvox reticuliferus]